MRLKWCPDVHNWINWLTAGVLSNAIHQYWGDHWMSRESDSSVWGIHWKANQPLSRLTAAAVSDAPSIYTGRLFNSECSFRELTVRSVFGAFGGTKGRWGDACMVYERCHDWRTSLVVPLGRQWSLCNPIWPSPEFLRSHMHGRETGPVWFCSFQATNHWVAFMKMIQQAANTVDRIEVDLEVVRSKSLDLIKLWVLVIFLLFSKSFL